jgi:hypothetical protein
MVTTHAKIIGAVAAGVGVIGLGLGLGMVAHKRRAKTNARTKRRTAAKRVRSRSYAHKKGRRYTPHTAGKRRDTSKRRIRYTKNGQPYIILRSGKARFISMRSAKSSHKRPGGRY